MISMILIIILIVCPFQSKFTNFEQYCKQYNKKYAPAEYAYRQQIYNSKIIQIERSNLQHQQYLLGINRFTDQNQTQLLALFPKLKVPQTTLLNSPTPTSSHQPSLRISNLAAKNWAAQGKITSVKDQKSCGACWAFTSIALFQSYLLINQNKYYDLSEQNVLQCTNDYLTSKGIYRVNDCFGGFVDDGLAFVESHGVLLEQQHPYKGQFYSYDVDFDKSSCKLPSKIQPTTIKSINRYVNITDQQLKSLLNIAPVGALFYNTQQFINYNDGVYSGCPSFHQSFANLNHAVLIVGYDSNNNWIIKNSWGSSWGKQGYALIKNTNNCGLTAYVYQIEQPLKEQQHKLSNNLYHLISTFMIFILYLLI